LSLRPVDDLDDDEIDRMTRQFIAEVKLLDIDRVERFSTGSSPAGAKGWDPGATGELLVALSASGGVFTVLIQTVSDWFSRHAKARKISVTVDGDTIELERSSDDERRELIQAFIRRHEAT